MYSLTTSNNLIIANRKLAFQKDEQGKRAKELIIANRELAFQTKEKGKRAEELTIANKELDYQNKEKEKRAKELVIANRELIFQNKEKENRAAELVIANQELAYQNEEKGRRAEELIIANKELKKAEEDIRKFNEELEQKVIERTAQKLLKIAFLQSHQVRVPIANILGLFTLFNFDEPSAAINGEVLIKLKLVAESLDKTIHEIVQNTVDIRSVIQNN